MLAHRSPRGSTATGFASGGIPRVWPTISAPPTARASGFIDPTHFAALFPAKPRAQTMLYREVLIGLGGVAPAFLSELSHRQRDRLRPEILAIDALYLEHGATALLAAMAHAETAGVFQADALAGLLAVASSVPPPTPAPALRLVGVPPQDTIDRALSVYEAWVEVDHALPEVG